MHVAERMRLIRQGDSREIADLEAALKQVRSTFNFFFNTAQHAQYAHDTNHSGSCIYHIIPVVADNM